MPTPDQPPYEPSEQQAAPLSSDFEPGEKQSPKRGLIKGVLLVALTAAALAIVAFAFILPRHETPTTAQQSGGPPNPANDERHQRAAALRKELTANPNNAAAHLQLGRVYIEQHRYAAAAQEARAARQDKALVDQADALLARSLYMGGETALLLRQVEPGEREALAESEVRAYLGLAHFLVADFVAADALFRDAVRLAPQYWLPHSGLARVLIMQRNLGAARQQVDAANALAPDELIAQRVTAMLLRAEGDTDGAIAAFGKALESYPHSNQALNGRADALISQDKLAEAQRDVDASLQTSNNNAGTRFLAALIATRKGELTKAVTHIQKAEPRFKSMRIGYLLEGVIKFRMGDQETAEHDLARFDGQQPNQPIVAHIRAEIALRRNDAETAIKLLQPLVAANPADTAAVNGLARAYLAEKEPEQALELFQAVDAATPRTVTEPVDVTGLVMMYGDAADDVVEIEKAASSMPPDATMAMICLRQGKVEKAAALAEGLAAHNPNDPGIQNLLGLVRLAQRRLPEAQAIFSGIVQQDPHFTDAGLNLARVLVAEGRLGEARTSLQVMMKPT